MDNTLTEGWTDVTTLPSGYDTHQKGWKDNCNVVKLADLTNFVKLDGVCATISDEPNNNKKQNKTKQETKIN